jgi:hypothetical protein
MKKEILMIVGAKSFDWSIVGERGATIHLGRAGFFGFKRKGETFFYSFEKREVRKVYSVEPESRVVSLKSATKRISASELAQAGEQKVIFDDNFKKFFEA